MLIAIASEDFRNVTGHAGKACRFLVFEAAADAVPRLVDRLDLPTGMSVHEFEGTGPHPLDSMKAVIAGGAGPGFVSRMATRGVEVAVTAETDPLVAVTKYLAGTLPGPGDDDHACTCHCH